MINHQLVLPVCHELPVVGSTLSYNCVRLGIPHVTKLIRPHGCYVDDGAGYRGTVSVTQSGRQVAFWITHHDRGSSVRGKHNLVHVFHVLLT